MLRLSCCLLVRWRGVYDRPGLNFCILRGPTCLIQVALGGISDRGADLFGAYI